MKTDCKGYLCIVLHAHLPYVRHPEHDKFLEEDWLYEAITETYIPIINVMQSLLQDNVDFRLTMSITPPLVSMFADPLLQDRYERHINGLIELAAKEITRTQWEPQLNHLAHMYHYRFTNARDVFVNHYGRNLANAFRKFQDAGKLEIITCAATHGYLPLMINETAKRAQIKIAADHYKRHFGRQARGIWLPECAYEPGLDNHLAEQGMKFFFTDTHGVLHATPRPKYGVFAPIACPSGVAAFARDVQTSKQVWSSIEGYPGDYVYRDFYRDVGYDLEYEYVQPYLHGGGNRSNLGIKYYAITGDTDHKQIYNPTWGLDRAAEHAGNFMFNREKQIEHLASIMDRQPIIVAPYDAELFGHWWFEGPDWLGFLFRKIYHDQNTIGLITPSEYLGRFSRIQVATPSMSSWGYKGYNEVWLEGSNDWIYRHLHIAADRMVELARNNTGVNGLRQRALNQAARELLLAQSSDWAFIMKTGTMVEYAVMRTKTHLLNFNSLFDQLNNGTLREGFLCELEGKNNIFPEIDYTVYS
jgi:1,4-alpha-glucan branching enzyme